MNHYSNFVVFVDKLSILKRILHEKKSIVINGVKFSENSDHPN